MDNSHNEGGGSCIYLQQDLRDDGVDIEQGVQVKTQELFPRPGKPTDMSGFHVRNFMGCFDSFIAFLCPKCVAGYLKRNALCSSCSSLQYLFPGSSLQLSCKSIDKSDSFFWSLNFRGQTLQLQSRR